MQGQYGYVDANGQQRIVKYTAGKDGFRAEGDGIPQPPPVAPAAPQQQQQFQPSAPQPQFQAPQFSSPTRSSFDSSEGPAFASFMRSFQ